MIYMPLMYDEISLALNWREERERADIFRKASAYELSEVMPLFEDWQREWKREVPKLPPCRNVWAEWADRRICPEHGEHTSRLGCWLIGQSAKEVQRWNEEDAGKWNEKEMGEREEAQHLFLAVMFMKHLEGVRGSPVMILPSLGKFAFAEDGSLIGIGHLDQGVFEAWKTERIFKAMVAPKNPHTEVEDWSQVAWPVIMAFALLHCHNITTEDHAPGSVNRRNRKESGGPPLVTYKTLRVQVPRSVHEGEKRYEEADDEPKVRYHLCSGHFHTFLSERFKKMRGRTIWYPAHYRGSKELGEVVTRRVLTP